MKKFILSACSLFLFCPFASSQQTKILSADKHNEYGLVYSLPLTAFEVEVETVKEVKKAGPFYKYAKKYIGTDNVIMQDSENWSIADIRVKPYGIPDPDNRYLMQLKPGATTFIAVDANGMLLSINQEPEPENNITTTAPESATDVPEIDEYLKFVPEDYANAISSAKKAQILADELDEIREARISLTRGTAETMPTDGRQLEIMLNSLKQQEDAMTAAFTGTVEKSVTISKFSFIPTEEGREIIFRMSDFAGPVEADDYSGEPVYAEVKIIEDGLLPLDAKGEEKKVPKDAVMYCIPGVAQITISSKGKEYFSKNMEVAQFGFLFGLNPNLFTDKKSPSYAIFDPATGALKELGTIKE